MKKTKRIEVRRVLHTPAGLRVREEGEEEAGGGRTITGYAILFGVPSAPLYESEEEEVREVIAPGAITRGLLDESDIKMTMFHDDQLLLARSDHGQGTLSYDVDEVGVRFSFEAPATADGDKALELVRRGDIRGCSFAFTTYYDDPEYVTRTEAQAGDKVLTTYTVLAVTGVYDFTLTAQPAYPDTSCEVENRVRGAFRPGRTGASAGEDDWRKQVRRMRRAASARLI